MRYHSCVICENNWKVSVCALNINIHTYAFYLFKVVWIYQ